mmetsp:Transcript_903/g.1276  ORF Transcript_903/g.1276 Transcript_903/m.1276 type:complete len:115 (+) Transcript_903:215-559(+)
MTSGRIFKFFQLHSPEKRRVWGVAAGVIVAGTVIKFAYFEFSRSLIMDDVTRRHLDATAHWSEVKKRAEWAEKDRSARVPPLTPEQKKQLQQYLILLAEENDGMYSEKELHRKT